MEEKIRNYVVSKLKYLKENDISELRFLGIISRNIRNRKMVTTRNIYYESINTFKNQNRVTRLVRKFEKIFKCSRADMMIKPSLKGLYSGNLEFVYNDGTIGNRMSGIGIIPDMNSIDSVRTNAKYILVVEKESVMDFIIHQEILVVCGKGYPCRNTIMLLKYLKNRKMFCLTDFDVYGFYIYLEYRKQLDGIVRMGVSLWDIFLISLRGDDFVNVNPREIKIGETLLKTLQREFFGESLEEKKDLYRIRTDLKFLLGLEKKIELEVLLNKDRKMMGIYMEKMINGIL